MENNEVSVETNKIEVPESFREKYTENPDLAIEQLYKAQHKIIEQKKAEKIIKTEAPSENLTTKQMETFYREQKFFESNPEMLEYKEQFNKLTSGDLSDEEAKDLIIKRNPDIVARQNTQNANFTAWTPDYSTASYTKEALWNMGQSEYRKAMALIESWKAVKVL